MDYSTLENLNFRLTLDAIRTMSKEQQDNLRLLCQTNLRFLANCVLRPPSPKKFPTLVEKVHGPIIDAFPQLDPKKEYDEWSGLEEFVIMASRGMLKSTIGAAFLTQVVLCAPDIRILIMSGKLDKAESILSIARNPFYSNPVIRHLFPEWMIEEEEIRNGEFLCPKRNKELNFREPTLETATFESVKAGGHYELVFLDDATNEINSSTTENCEKTHGAYDDIDPLVEPGGYRVFLCTKWGDDDLPEYIRRKGEEEKEKSGTSTYSYLVQPAWRLRLDGTPLEVGRRQDREKTGQLTPEDVDLTWPEKLTAKMLFKMYRKNRADFYKQYLLDASIEQQKSFKPEILLRQTQSPNQLYQIPQHDRSVVVHWDLASVFTGRRKKSETDFSCGIVAVFQNSTGRMLVAQAVLAHFNTGADVAHAVINLYQTAQYFGPVVGHSMEDAMGARNLEDQIYSVARDGKINLKPIHWELPERDKNGKNARIAMLATAMEKGYVVLLSNIAFLDDIKSQFERWSIDAKRRKDDGPDCIAQIWRYYSPKIRPKTVESLKPSEQILSWEPHQVVEEAPDPHQEEHENADVEWLNTFTVPHAGN